MFFKVVANGEYMQSVGFQGTSLSNRDYVY